MGVELSIVLLCYRSDHRVREYAAEIKNLIQSLSDDFEIILVGNYFEGSADPTKEILEDIARNDNCFKTVCKPKKGMMGWDMKEGLASAQGDFLCVIDGDGQFPFETIVKCYDHIKSGNYGLVKTFRYEREDGFYRKTISLVYNWIFALLFPEIRSKDVNSKPKMFTREAYKRLELTSDDWFIDAEIMIEIGRSGIPFFEIPVRFNELEGRKSFVKPYAIFEFLVNLISFRLKGFFR